MRLRFWGVRGAITATEGSHLGVGGNTPCIELRGEDGHLVVLDAGIGLYWLGRSLLTGPHGRGQGQVTLLLTHSHWDHIQGIPFFVPGFIPGNTLDIWGGGVDHLDAILEGQMDPTYSPLVSMGNLGAKVSFGNLDEHAELEAGELTVTHATFQNGPHEVVGYRIQEGDKSVCYVAEVDHPPDGLSQAVVALARGADLLIHEAYYTNEELARGGISLAGPSGPPAEGHSSFGQATDVALAASAKRLLYFYHHPDHDDATIEAAVDAERRRLEARGSALVVDTAREGREYEI